MSAFTGKTALVLGIGLYARSKGRRVGYLKPISVQGYRPQDLRDDVDPDAVFVKRVFGLGHVSLDTVAPVRINADTLQQVFDGAFDLPQAWARIDMAYQELQANHDLILLESGATLRDSYTVGIHTQNVVERFGWPVLLVANWQDINITLDEILSAHALLGQRLLGAVINSVPDTIDDQTVDQFVTFLQMRGVVVYGVLPLQPQLRAISIQELAEHLDATTLTGEAVNNQLIEALSVGAMTVESALPLLRDTQNKAIITGADRTDLQGAALELNSVICLVLTGTNTPNPNILQRAESLGVAVLSVTEPTMQVLEKIERIFGKTPLSQAEKLNRFQAILAQHLDYESLFDDLERIQAE